MGQGRRLERIRRHLALGQVRGLLSEREEVAVWAHVHAPEGGQHGVLALTSRRCVVQWAGHDAEDVVVAWDEVATWSVEHPGRGDSVLTFATSTRKVMVGLPVSSKARARVASRVLRRFAELTPGDTVASRQVPEGAELEARAERRGLYGHTRRVLVTVIGLAVITLGLLFASPFVPGPGALTLLAGLTILATEYDWAKDVRLWLRRLIDRMLDRVRAARARRRARRRGGA